MQKFIYRILEFVIFEKLLASLMDKNNRKRLGEYVKNMDKNTVQYSFYKFFKYIVIFIVSFIILILVLIGLIIYFIATR